MSEENILICGLPDSGKTTFIAALWYLLFEEEVNTNLLLASHPKSREYLNMLSSKWCRFTPIDRTATDETQEILLHLKDRDSGEELDLRVPDMSGETWENIWSHRSCAQNAADWARDSSGVMLFIHADKIRQPVDIQSNNDESATPEEMDEVAWSPIKSPTQVKLVDILQALSYQPLGDNNRQLAIIISAWDTANDTGLTPDKYVETYLPLLHQFLINSGLFSQVRIYGVSALGGDLGSEAELKILKAENTPSKRIKVVEGDKLHHDLTVPIQQLISK